MGARAHVVDCARLRHFLTEDGQRRESRQSRHSVAVVTSGKRRHRAAGHLSSPGGRIIQTKPAREHGACSVKHRRIDIFINLTSFGSNTDTGAG
ncbi:hypothetical protein ABVT39_013403 [Epinephelus coioides]